MTTPQADPTPVDHPKYPDLVITHPARRGEGGFLPTFSAKILLDGQDITHWVNAFHVGGSPKEPIELHLTVLVSSVLWTQTD